LSYKAIIARVHTREHPNADKLQLGSVAGNQVVVGLDVEDGTLGVFFPTDGLLSNEYCEANDLYPRFDEDGKRIGGGFFDPKRPRVRSQNFRGEKSDGYWAPVSSLAYTGIDLELLVEGYEFDELNGQKICEKFYSKATLRAMAGKANSPKKKNLMFREHVDTKQFRFELERIPDGSLLTLTEKVHGTSHRVGHVLDEIHYRDTRPSWKKWLGLLARKPWNCSFSKLEWTILNGTRRVVLQSEKDIDGGFYGSHKFRYDAVNSWAPFLHKGEVVYGELVGYSDNATPIMQQRALKGIKELNEVRKQYGEEMSYSYGCQPGECRFYVYRITQVNEDGIQHELTWPQVKTRAGELGIATVPEMKIGSHLFAENMRANPFLYYGNTEGLQALVDDLMEGPSTLDPSHIREGVVVRVDKPNGTTDFLKAKSFTFGLLEGYIKSDEDYVDLEEIS
jgi:hypothetical protein